MANGSAPKPSAEGTQSSSLAELTLRAVVDLSDDVLFFLGPEKQIRWMSQRAAQLTRVAKDSAVGQEITKVINSIGLDRAIERSLETGKVQRATVKIGADQLDMEARIIPIVVPSTSDGNVEAVVLSLAELEFEKRLQSMRREFVANVSHELRSPLTSILGYAETLLEDPPDDEEQRRRFLTAIVREARRMQRLVEDLLNLSRIESGRAAPQFEGVNLHNVVGRVLTQLRDQAERAGVSLSNFVPPDLRLECDPGQIEQVVYNLVINGIQYTPAGGKVVVSGRANGTTVSFTVADTGIGIPPADLPRVFERFYRVDKARSRATGATGLGLSIVKHIVDAHNGKVSVDSKLGKGTSFTVELPATQPSST